MGTHFGDGMEEGAYLIQVHFFLQQLFHEFACRVLPFYEVSSFVASEYILSHALVEKRSLATLTLWPAILVTKFETKF